MKYPFFLPVKVPSYRAGKFGRWELKLTKGAMPGYFTPTIMGGETAVLTRKSLGGGAPKVWMSLAMMERESHMPHIAAATGHVVVMGLGMGMYLYNIIDKPDVTAVTVIERDPQVIKMFYHTANPTAWDGLSLPGQGAQL